MRKQLEPIAHNQQQAHKRLVINHYSEGMMICRRCGFSDIRALSIDHINGGGYKHIRTIKGDFYSWLIKSNYPTGFQVLCMNCQWLKRDENHECRRSEKRAWGQKRSMDEWYQYIETEFARLNVNRIDTNVLCQP